MDVDFIIDVEYYRFYAVVYRPYVGCRVHTSVYTL
jgi:hypothetical protein